MAEITVANGEMTTLERLVLDVCLADDANVSRCFEALVHHGGADPNALVRMRHDLIAVLSLVAARTDQSQSDIPAAWTTRLQGAMALEVARAKAFDDIVGPILRNPDLHKLEPIVTRGAAIAAAAYPDGFYRHTSHFSFLIASPDMYQAATASITATGCTFEHEAQSRLLFRHRSGMPVFVFGGKPCNRLRDFSYQSIRPAAQNATVAGAAALIPSASALWTDLVYSAHVYDDVVDAQWMVDAVWVARRFPHVLDGSDDHHQDSRITLPYDMYADYVGGLLNRQTSTPTVA